MIAHRLAMIFALGAACIVADVAPAEAQTKPPVTITIKGGTYTVLNNQPVSDIHWSKGTLSIYGPKDAAGQYRGYCVVKSANDATLFAIQQRVTEAKTATRVDCNATTQSTSKYQIINIDTQSGFALNIKQ